LIAAALVLSGLAGWTHLASASGAVDELRLATDKVLSILADADLKGEARAGARHAALRGVMENAIDFPKAARRALALHWRARTDAEREEFVALFKDLVTYSYIRLMETYTGVTVRIAGEPQAEGETITIVTRIHHRRGDPVPVDYRMHLRGTRWLIDDVVVSGVSLVGNYRVQFNTIIQTTSFEELIRRMRARVMELNQPPAAAARVVAPRG
jgi:phospholipid transport system substrate-binding protein